uniref:ATPase n=1 Tax=Apple proliferation phytoplasma TaxID=37692 RepID=M1X6V3_APPPP|nr:ATPase [Candidatus Phytoplasma mali]
MSQKKIEKSENEEPQTNQETKPITNNNIKFTSLVKINLILFIFAGLFISGFIYFLLLNTNVRELEKRVIISENDFANLKTTLNQLKETITKANLEKETLSNNGNQEDLLIPQFQISDPTKFLSFDKLIGFKEEKVAVDGFIDYIYNKTKYENVGDVEPPLGILLYGCPGTGKTTLARAVAKETKLPFLEISSSMFSQKYRGIAPQMVKDLFATAREVAEQKGGAIIFLDECETIFVNINNLEANSEVANVVNAFKTEMTSIDNNPNKPVFVIAATNHIDQLEEAIKSRFTYNIEVKPFARQERQEFLEFMINRRRNPYSDESKKYLFEVINVALDDYQGENSFLKSNRTLENILKTAINVFCKNREIMEPKTSENSTKSKLREQIEKSDLKTAYSMVVSKDTTILDKIENSTNK